MEVAVERNRQGERTCPTNRLHCVPAILASRLAESSCSRIQTQDKPGDLACVVRGCEAALRAQALDDPLEEEGLARVVALIKSKARTGALHLRL